MGWHHLYQFIVHVFAKITDDHRLKKYFFRIWDDEHIYEK